MYYTKISSRAKDQLFNHHNRLLKNLQPSLRRSLIEYSYGILQSGDVLLSRTARALNEKNTIRKTIERISRNLSKKNFEDEIQNPHMQHVADQIGEDWIEVTDLTDISKPRAKKMEGLAEVYDGSEGAIANGYSVIRTIAVSPDRTAIVPILMHLYSTLDDNFVSQNHEIELHLNKIEKAGIRCRYQVCDSGFSGENQMRILEKQGLFVVRINTERNIVVDKQEQKLLDWADKLPLPYVTTVTYLDDNGKEIIHSVSYIVKEIVVGSRKGHALIMRLDDHEPCILFTNDHPAVGKSLKEFGKKVIDLYGCRWSVEEFIRFEKQQFNMENVRLQKLIALKNFIAMINILSGFIVKLSLRKIARHLTLCAKPLKAKVRMVYYRIADGVRAVFSRRSKMPFPFSQGMDKFRPERQLIFEYPGGW